MRLRRPQFFPLFSSALSVGLLGGLGGYRAHFQPTTPQADQYHQRVRDAAASLPMRVDTWIGRDIPVTTGATALLNPNIIISRQFTDAQTGRAVNFLIVQCKDARDMLGHYPPKCYPAHGWTAPVPAEPRTWQIDDWAINGVAYEYSKVHLDDLSHVVIYDFMALPDGRTCREMDDLEHEAQGYATRHFGAAQIQVEFNFSVPPAERDRIFAIMIRAYRPVLDQIRSGILP